MQRTETMKAFRTVTDGYGGGIVFAETRSKAMWVAVASYCDIFDARPVDAFSMISISRAGEYDEMYSRGSIKKRHHYCESYIQVLYSRTGEVPNAD